MSLQLAFEITLDDIQIALGGNLTDKEARYALEHIDCDRASNSALRGNDIDDQTRYAHEDIQEQASETLEQPLYFHVLSLRGTFSANTLIEAINCLRSGGDPIPDEFVYNKIKEAYAAGHDISDYISRK
jgi:hypothetical protein